MTERTNTAQWIESRQRWQINVQKNGQRKTFTSAKPGRTGQREANAKADTWLKGAEVKPSTKIEVLYPQFLETKQATTSESNWRPMESRWRNRIAPVIASKSIGKLTQGDVQDVIDAALAQGLSKKSLQNLRADLNNFLKWCRKHQYSALRCEDVEIPHSAKSGERHILQPRDVVILFNSSTTLRRGKRVDDPYINAYRLALLTGMRPGELLGLRWEDWSGHQLNLKRAMNYYGKETTGKNENAQRPVYLSDFALQVLQEQFQLTGPEGPIFCIKDQRIFAGAWLAYCKANGIQPVSPYELRHTFVSLADALPEGQLKKLVGHSQSMDTYGVYSHEVSGEGEAISENLTEIFKQILDV